jgi:hypothetical protein
MWWDVSLTPLQRDYKTVAHISAIAFRTFCGSPLVGSNALGQHDLEQDPRHSKPKGAGCAIDKSQQTSDLPNLHQAAILSDRHIGGYSLRHTMDDK